MPKVQSKVYDWLFLAGWAVGFFSGPIHDYIGLNFATILWIALAMVAVSMIGVVPRVWKWLFGRPTK